MKNTMTKAGVLRQPYRSNYSKRFAVRFEKQLVMDKANELDILRHDLENIVKIVNQHSTHLNRTRSYDI
jgi:hypothetical protein